MRENDSRRVLWIEGAERNPVRIEHTSTGFRVEYAKGGSPLDCAPYAHRVQTGLFEYYRLSRAVAAGLMEHWNGPPDHPRNRRPQGPAGRSSTAGAGPTALVEVVEVPKPVREWAVRQTAKAIGKRLHGWYRGRLAETPPVIRDVQRTVFAATFSTPTVLLSESFYEQDPFLLKDLARYRAASVALAVPELFTTLRDRLAVDVVAQSAEYARLHELASRLGVRVDLREGRVWELSTLMLDVHHRDQVDAPRDRQQRREERIVELMQDWRGLFSPTGESYRSLDRTLMNLPGGLSASLVPHLKMVRLRRPATTRLEVAVICLYGRGLLVRSRRLHDEFGVPSEIFSRTNESVFLGATPDRINRVVKLVGDHTRNTLSARRTKDLAFVVRFLMDYPEEHRGNIVGLAEKAIAWHRAEVRREAEKVVERLGGQHETASPPIEVPADERLRFLATVADVCEEGTLMENCVASYAQRAVRGDCYLFHASHNGEEATVHLDRAGKVVQAAGPRNQRNAAATWGSRVLGRWGREFPAGHASHVDFPAGFDDADVPF
jgi:hypothetical protein